MTFADQLRSARGSLSQSQAAATISPMLSVRTLQDWEQAKRRPADWAQDLVLRVLRSPKKVRTRKGQNKHISNIDHMPE